MITRKISVYYKINLFFKNLAEKIFNVLLLVDKKFRFIQWRLNISMNNNNVNVKAHRYRVVIIFIFYFFIKYFFFCLYIFVIRAFVGIFYGLNIYAFTFPIYENKNSGKYDKYFYLVPLFTTIGIYFLPVPKCNVICYFLCRRICYTPLNVCSYFLCH